MPSLHLYTVSRPPKPKRDWIYAPTTHVCHVGHCAGHALFGETHPLSPVERWYCAAHAPDHFFAHLDRPRLTAPRPTRAPFRLDDLKC